MGCSGLGWLSVASKSVPELSYGPSSFPKLHLITCIIFITLDYIVCAVGWCRYGVLMWDMYGDVGTVGKRIPLTTVWLGVARGIQVSALCD